jgi:hypothetical protein
MFTMANSNHPNHTVLARKLQKYLRWRNANARHPDVLAAQRRERARIRSERQQRWGRPAQGRLTTQTRRTFMDDALVVLCHDLRRCLRFRGGKRVLQVGHVPIR